MQDVYEGVPKNTHGLLRTATRAWMANGLWAEAFGAHCIINTALVVGRGKMYGFKREFFFWHHESFSHWREHEGKFSSFFRMVESHFLLGPWGVELTPRNTRHCGGGSRGFGSRRSGPNFRQLRKGRPVRYERAEVWSLSPR